MSARGDFSEDGVGEAVVCFGPTNFIVSGTFGGGSISLQYLDVDGTWRNFGDAGQFSADGHLTIDVGPRTGFRFELSGSTTPTIAWSILTRNGR